MSIQFGHWNFDGGPVKSEYLERVRGILAPYGPHGQGSHSESSVAILYLALHATRESRRETQPYTTKRGAILTWDGRLDNRDELVRELASDLDASSTDVSIAAKAYEDWGTQGFGKLVGDWALSVWEPTLRSLLLAKDPLGSRPLYYVLEADQARWSSLLDPLVLLANRSFALNQEYLAGWLSYFPSSHLTPYAGIQSVPPSSFVLLGPNRHLVHKYWEFDPHQRGRYRADQEYEEHFRHVFRGAIRRTLRSDRPVLAELSGGRDSSAIVCMADELISAGHAEAPRLDTVSYYDDSEPNWNERPYFAAVEAKRGRTGWHIDISSGFECEAIAASFAASPASLEWRGQSARRQFAACVASGGNTVLLTGIGGDEFTGGVPAVEPELQDLLASAHVGAFFGQLRRWALYRKRPWTHLFWEAIRGFFPAALAGLPGHLQPLGWIKRDFVERNSAALRGYETRVKLFGPLPSFQENLSTLECLVRQISCTPLAREPLCEMRYPFLDRDFLQFLFSIPREQLIRPGHSRSLMRRALSGIVPDAILNRKRKAFIVRSPMLALSKLRSHFAASGPMVSDSMGIIDQKKFLEALERAHTGMEISVVGLTRTLALEFWLKTREESQPGPERWHEGRRCEHSFGPTQFRRSRS